MSERYVVDLAEVGAKDTGLVGGKNASLGEMIGNLGAAGIRVPDGFATTADAYWAFLDGSGLRDEIAARLQRLDRGEAELAEVGGSIRELILGADFPAELRAAIEGAYRRLAERSGVEGPTVAVRSSATAEDLPQASFA
ncbi:MAG TPA: PEP/pyruvate-binding domain-containing protein, partial [Solirubrobacterales bacterium]|nr:PEP/pyruvate-binding domain-containing protein [Solirubrobacterales bacterium]